MNDTNILHYQMFIQEKLAQIFANYSLQRLFIFYFQLKFQNREKEVVNRVSKSQAEKINWLCHIFESAH